jgi:hypothetical protein
LDEDIDAFGIQCNILFELWVDLLTGLEGVTNCIYMIGSGHMTYYLQEWENLYRYSQQGLEALSSLLKNIYFRRTQPGGHKEDGKSRNSVSSCQLPNGCSGGYTFFLVDTKTVKKSKEYFK